MTPDPHSLLAPYVLDALDADERETFEAHLDQCEACRDELPGLVATVDRVAEADAATPPPALRASVLAAVSQTPQQRPVVALDARRRARRRLPQAIAAAALAVAVAGGGLALVERDRAETLQADQQHISAVMTAADASTADTSVTGGGTLRVISSKRLGSAVVSGSALKALDDDHVYQLWTMHGGTPKAAGLLGTSDGMVYVGSMGDADAVAVTVEPKGGSQQPTTAPVALTRMT